MTRHGGSPPLPDAARDAMAPLPDGYVRLLERVVAAVDADERVRACWLAGSVGRGAADPGSDLDILLAVADTQFDAFAAGWRDWLGRVAPVVLGRELAGRPGSFYSVTAACERLDVVSVRVGDLPRTPFQARVLLRDREGCDALLPRRDHQDGRSPDPSAMAATVEEFLRQQAIFPAAVVARGDWLLGVVGVTVAQQLLYRLFVEANQPLPPMGVKQWSSRLTAPQRELLESLPVPQPRRDDVVSAMLAVRRAMLTAGRATAREHGVSWPEELDAAVGAYFIRELGTPDEPSDGSSSAVDA